MVVTAEPAVGQSFPRPVPVESWAPSSKRACDHGDAVACYYLADAYQLGSDGLPKDAGEAVALWKKACDGGVDRGCSSLANAYELGMGGSAKTWPRLPCSERESFGLAFIQRFNGTAWWRA